MTLPSPGGTGPRQPGRRGATARALLVTALVAGLTGCLAGSTREPTAPDPTSSMPADPPGAEPVAERPPPGEVETREPGRGDVWARIRAGLALPVDQQRTREQVDWLRRNQRYLDRIAERARYYLPYIVAEIEQRQMPMELALVPFVESALQPFARSPAGAAGIWQFMPSTGRAYGLRRTWWYDGRRDTVDSTRAALDYLARMHAEFDDWLLAVAAYNAGEGNVRKALRRNRRAGKPLDYWSLPLPRETRRYLPRLLAYAAVVADPAAHGLELLPVSADHYFEVVPIESQLDLAIAAESAGISLDELYLLNPGFGRWATDPDGPHRLAVPVAAAERFRTRLAALPADERLRWQRHRVEPGDTLGEIAERYRTSVAAIREANELTGRTIRAGSDLRVPVAARPADSYHASEDVHRLIGRPTGHTRSIHVVQPGESLWLIARRHDLRVKQLVAWNGLDRKSVLRPGQKLVIRGEPTLAASAEATPASEPAKRGAGLYTVRPGDSLWLIARRHSVSVSNLTRWNGLSRTALEPGQKLRVRAGTPARRGTSTSELVHYTVRRGDSLWEIARRFSVSVAALRQWNQLAPGGHLQPGQQLSVYVERGTTARPS